MELEGNCCAPIAFVLASELTIGTGFYHATVEVKKYNCISVKVTLNFKLTRLDPQLGRVKLYTGSVRTAQLRSSKQHAHITMVCFTTSMNSFQGPRVSSFTSLRQQH